MTAKEQTAPAGTATGGSLLDGFAFPQREGIYDKASAERHWERLFGLFRRVLG